MAETDGINSCVSHAKQPGKESKKEISKK